MGYWPLEIPGAILVERWSARKWCRSGRLLPRSGRVPDPLVPRSRSRQGAGGITGGLSRIADRGRAAFGGSDEHSLARWSGWRWLLILEGGAAIVAGVWAFFYLTDRPKNAKWLTIEERDWISNELEQEKRSLIAQQQVSVWRVIFQPQVLLLTAIWFFSISVGNACTLWLPKIVQRMSGYSPVVTTLVSAIPFLAALPFTLLVDWNSDRTGERRWHTAGCVLLAAGGLALSQAMDNIPIGIFALTVAAMGISGRQAPFWSVSSSLLAGISSAVAIAVISSFGQLGGVAGPYIVGFLTDRTGSMRPAPSI